MSIPIVPEFKELKIDSLIQLGLDDVSSSSTELWLIKWPFEQSKTNPVWPTIADFDAQEATFKLNSDIEFGSVQSSSGKSYELSTMQSYQPEEVVFLPSASETRIVGKISRHVSVLYYPEPSELLKPDKDLERKLGQGSSGTFLTGSTRRTATPTQTIRTRHIQDSHTTSNPSSGKSRSSTVIAGSLDSQKSKSKKRKHSSDGGSLGHSDRDSGRGHKVTSSGGSPSQSQERKSNKKKKKELNNEG